MLTLLLQQFFRLKGSAVMRSFIWLALDRGVRMTLSIGVGLLVARYLGPRQFGLLNFALAAVALAGPVAEMGLDAVARREFVRQPERSAAIAGTVIRLRLCGGGVAICAIVCAALLLARSAEERLLLVVLSLAVLQPAGMIVETWMQSRYEARRSVVPQWCALFLGAGARLLAIRLQAPLSVFAIISVIEIGVTILLVAMAARRLGLVKLHFDTGLARVLLCEGWPWAVSSAAVMIYMRIDVLMLRTMVGDSAAGVYAAAVRLSELGYFLPVIVANSVQPSLLKVKERDLGCYNSALQRYFRLSVLGAYALALPIALMASPIISLAYGAQFAEAGPILAVHAWATVFVFLGVARSQYLVNAGLARFGLMCTLVGALINVVLNLVLIPLCGGGGAAVATVVSYAVAGWVTSFFTPGTRWIGWMQTKSLFWPVTT